MFCSNCGKEASGKFCANCGLPMDGAVHNEKASTPKNAIQDTVEKTLWEGQPCGIVDKAKTAANVNSTYYKITNQRVIINTGLIGKRQEEIELYRIKDYKVVQSITNRLLKIGDVVIISTDLSTPQTVLANVQSPNEVKDILRNAVLDYRVKMNISYRELM